MIFPTIIIFIGDTDAGIYGTYQVHKYIHTYAHITAYNSTNGSFCILHWRFEGEDYHYRLVLVLYPSLSALEITS